MTLTTKILKFINRYLFYTIVFLFPLFFLPIFPNYFETGKLLFLTSGLLLLAIIKIVGTLMENTFKLSTSKIDIFVVAFSVAYLVSGLVASPNKLASFFVPGAATFIILSCLLYFFATQLQQNERKDVEMVLVVSTLIAALAQIVSFSGLIQKNFSTFGNLLASLTYYIAVLPIAFHSIFKSTMPWKKMLFGAGSFIILIGVFISVYLALPGKDTSIILPKLSTTWSITIDSLRVSPLLGVGPSNYSESYNKFRPLESNLDDTWASTFLVSSNTPFTIFAEAGLIGLVTFFAIFYFSLRKLKLNSSVYVSLLAIFLMSLVMPLPLTVFPLILLLVALNTDTQTNLGHFTSRVPLMIATLPFTILIVFGGFYSFKAFWGEYNYFDVITQINKNDGIKAYDAINKTITINPYAARYHLAASSINMALANSLAQTKDLSDADKQTLTQLVQQAVQEAKAAVSLNPRSSGNWENLGDIYNNIISFAQDADTFAIQAYSQAIYLNPINPNLRIKLGGVYYGQKNYVEAVRSFELAAVAKTDYANAHYNLAMAYKENKQLDKAKEQMNITLSLVGRDSADYEAALKELQNLEGLVPPTTPAAPVIEPPIEVPNADVNPTAEPSPSPVPTE